VRSLFFAAAAAAFTAPASVGQVPPTPDAANSQIETIFVTGTRQAYQGVFRPLEIPQAELVIDAQVLRDAGAVSLDQALDLSASVARQNNFGGLWNSFAVRGFVGDENLPSNYLVNGFNAGRGFGGPRDMSGIERVEVLKGPRAALFGRGEPGGTINLVTKRPLADGAGEIRLSAGSFDTYRAEADWTGPLIDAVAVRLVGFAEDAGSFRDAVETTRYGVTPSVLFSLGADTRLVYEAELSRQEIPFDRGVIAVDGRLGVIPRSRFLGEPGDGPLVSTVAGHQVEIQHDVNADWSILGGATYRDTSLKGFSTEPELAAGRQSLFVDGQTLSRQRRFRQYDATYWVVRGEITGRFQTGGLDHRIMIGADADRFENDQVFLRARPPALSSDPSAEELQAIDIFNPVYGRFPLPEPGPLTDRVEVQESVGAFLQNQTSVTDRFDVRFGLRYDDYAQRLDNRLSGAALRQSQTRLSPQFGAVYAATGQLSVYAAYGENFRPLLGADAQGDPFDPNVSTAAEAGVKFEMADRALAATFSLFQINQSNLLVADPANPGFSIAAGEARSQGIEIDVHGEVAEGLTVWASYAYVNATIRNDVLDPNFGLPIQAGTRLLNIPEHTLSLQLAQDFRVGGRPARVGGGVLHVGRRLGEVATDFELPAYTLLRAFVEHDLTEALALRLEADNLLDETYYPNSFSQLWIQPGTPRSFRATAAFRF
jgi:iron complex outermembrane receptor protein